MDAQKPLFCDFVVCDFSKKIYPFSTKFRTVMVATYHVELGNRELPALCTMSLLPSQSKPVPIIHPGCKEQIREKYLALGHNIQVLRRLVSYISMHFQLTGCMVLYLYQLLSKEKLFWEALFHILQGISKVYCKGVITN